jgi:PKD repeat protein
MLRRVFCKLLLVAVVLFWALSGVLFAQGRSEEALERAIAAQEKHTKVLMAKDGVEGTAVGADENDQFVVKVYTARPGVTGIPLSLEGVPVREVVSGKIYARVVDPTDRFVRPVPTGVSTGHPDITAGTIACRVKDSAGNVYALSNNHVYANENRASIGDNVLQPGTYDGGINPNDAIGTLYDFEPIVFGMWGVNIIDAAIALCSTGTLGNSTPEDGYGIPNSETLPVSEDLLGQAVQKYGRTTGLTTGTVTGINGAFLVRYSRSFAIFYDQIAIEVTGFSAGGDSGSLIVTDDGNKNPVGLLFAGSDTMTIANPIGPVLSLLDVTIDDSSGGGTTNDPPTADFTYTTTDLTAYFTDHSTDSDGTISSWSWNFGDGATSTMQNPEHAYATDGTYTVSLTVTDDDGATTSASQDVTISSGGGGGGNMYVSDIYMWYSTAGPNYFVYTEVTILDDSDNPVSYATVDLTAMLPDGSTGSGSGATGTDGTVTFKIKSRQTGLYKSMVTDVSHASLTYEAGDNIVTEKTLNVP